MDWNDIKEKQPEVDGFVFVVNKTIGAGPLMARYFINLNIFCLADARLKDTTIMFPVLITHWAHVPDMPQ